MVEVDPERVLVRIEKETNALSLFNTVGVECGN